MEKNKYIPQPIDTSDIQLPEELNPLLEAMAKNVHEIWICLMRKKSTTATPRLKR